MSTLLDIILSTFLGGVILLITLNANITLRETWTSYNHQVMVQQMLVSTAQILEGDLRNMGCGVSVTTETVTEADTSCISFLMALRPEWGSTPVPIRYHTGNVSDIEVIDTDNPNDRVLYRTQSGVTVSIGLVTKFRLRYMDEWGTEILPTPVSSADRINIKIIEITMEVQSPYTVIWDPDQSQRYASALWKQTRLASQNFNR